MPRQFTLLFANGDWSASVTAAGSTQGSATALTTNHSYVTSVSTGQGVVLPTSGDGEEFSVANADSADGLLVYPPSGAVFNGATVNYPVLIPAQTAMWCKFVSSTRIIAVIGGGT